MKLYCKKADLTLFNKTRVVKYMQGFNIYILSRNEDYTRHEVEMKMKENKDKILEKLRRMLNKYVIMSVHGEPIAKIDAEERYGLLMTPTGCILQEAVVLEI